VDPSGGFSVHLGRFELQNNVDAADHEDAVLQLDFADRFRHQALIRSVNVTRLQRASEGSRQSTSRGRDNVIQGSGVRFQNRLRDFVVLGPFKTVWRLTIKRAGVPYFRIYDLRSTYATRLSAGGVADEWVTQLLRQGDAKVFKKYSQMKLQMKREALAKLDRQTNEGGFSFGTAQGQSGAGFGTV